MIGIGAIWKRFVSGELADDDEVAVTFVPGTYELVAHPLVQVREAARLAGECYPQVRDPLQGFVEEVRSWPFAERTLENIERSAAALLGGAVPWPRLRGWLMDAQHDLKRVDALSVA